MPQSQKPRRPRGTPPHVRDLQALSGRVAATGMPLHEARLAEQLADASKGPNRLQRGGAKLSDAARATTTRGDAILGRMGVRTKTGALLLGGGAVAASRPRRKVEKSARTDALSRLFSPEKIEQGARMVAAAAGEAKKPAARARKAPARPAAAKAPAAAPEKTKRQLRMPNPSTQTKLAAAGAGGLFGGAALIGAGNGLGHRATDRRVHKNSTQVVTNVRRVATPRGPSGKFVSHENDLKIYTPKFSTSRRAPRDSRLQVWGKGKDKTSRTFVGKAAEPSMADLDPYTGARRGRRLV